MVLIKDNGQWTFFNSGKWESWFNIYIQKPLHTWKLAKKYFKKPKMSFKMHRVTKVSSYPYASWKRIGKILDINIHDVEWKDKWYSPRHERSPLIWICLFRCIAFSVQFHIDYFDEFGEKQNGDMEYWEYVLEWLYYKNKKTLRCYSAWTGDSLLYRQHKYGHAEDGSEDTFEPHHYVIPTVAMSLNKEGIKELKKELNE